uniref:Uncharacterized protein n=1 Tax=Onchocerca volvulus TaxID=6282 RepID=A0A8R1XSE6_ONCVO
MNSLVWQEEKESESVWWRLEHSITLSRYGEELSDTRDSEHLDSGYPKMTVHSNESEIFD